MTIQAGTISLEGLLERPDESAAWGGAAFCHPHPLYGGTMHNGVVARVTAALVESGIAVLRFNFRGVGRSQGSYAGGVGEQDDLRAALAYLSAADGMGGKPRFAIGYSFGAAVAARALCRHADAASALVCIALPVGSAPMGDFDGLKACPIPKLFLAGTEDDSCPVPALRELVGAMSEPKSPVVLDATDHFFMGRETDLATPIVQFLTTIRAAP